MIGLIVACSKNNVVGKNYVSENLVTVGNLQEAIAISDGEFDVVMGETSGEDIKYTRTIYTRRKYYIKMSKIKTSHCV